MVGVRTGAGEIGAGIRLALRGLGMWARTPRVMLLGAAPALFTALLFGAAFIATLVTADDVGRAVASGVGADGLLAQLITVAAALAVLAAVALVGVAAFTSVTLLIGQPFFEAVSRRIDEREGGLDAPAPEEPWWPQLRRGIGEGLLTVAISLAVSATLLVIGLVPVVGSITAFTVGAVVGGRLLAIELAGYPMARRGVVARRERIAALRPLRLRTIAFGATLYLVFLLPLGAVVAMPAAVAGATLLARDATAAR